MIKITKPGKSVFNAKCSKCGCEFTYELEDLWKNLGSEYVKCPECGDMYFHPSQSNKWATKPVDLQPPFGITGDSVSNNFYSCMQGDHEWECCGISTTDTYYRCRICGKSKTEQVSNIPNVTTVLF